MDAILEQLTHQRLELDKIFQSLDADNITEENPFFAKHATKLAFMWLGKAKGALGSPNPYPNSTDSSNKNIEPATDEYTGDILPPKDEISFLKDTRKALEEVEKGIRHGLMVYMTGSKFYQLAVERAYENVCEAKMFLGLALAELRKDTTEVVETTEGAPIPVSVGTEPGIFNQKEIEGAPMMVSAPENTTPAAVTDPTVQVSTQLPTDSVEVPVPTPLPTAATDPNAAPVQEPESAPVQESSVDQSPAPETETK